MFFKDKFYYTVSMFSLEYIHLSLRIILKTKQNLKTMYSCRNQQNPYWQENSYINCEISVLWNIMQLLKMTFINTFITWENSCAAILGQETGYQIWNTTRTQVGKKKTLFHRCQGTDFSPPPNILTPLKNDASHSFCKEALWKCNCTESNDVLPSDEKTKSNMPKC